MKVRFISWRLLLTWILVSLISMGVIYHWTHRVKCRVSFGKDTASLNLMFPVPVKDEYLDGREKCNLTFSTEYPSGSIEYYYKWITSRRLNIKVIEKGQPRGQLIRVAVKDVKTKVPFLYNSQETEYRYPINPRLELLEPRLDVPTKGPFLLKFNTPLLPTSLEQNVEFPVALKIRPLKLSQPGGQEYTDYSQWLVSPETPLKENKSYLLALGPHVTAKNGRRLGAVVKVELKTADRPRVVDIYPGNNQVLSSLFENVVVKTDMPLQKAMVKVFRMPIRQKVEGKLRVDGLNITFTPEYAFLPDSDYLVELTGDSLAGEPLSRHITTFHTRPMNKYWVEVKMGVIHTLTVYKDKYPIRMMLASCGRPGHETPRGTFYTGDRGWGFWAARFNEGAYYWVRLTGPYLIHSVPVDQQWQIKEEEHAKLGLPASHGCVRLSKVDARWFYENVPKGIPVIIHE